LVSWNIEGKRGREAPESRDMGMRSLAACEGEIYRCLGSVTAVCD